MVSKGGVRADSLCGGWRAVTSAAGLAFGAVADALYKGVREANGDAKKAPEILLYGHIDGAAKRSLTLYVDDYDRQSDRIYFRFAPPVETHGCPIFYEGRWVGNVTTETEPNRSVVVPGEHRPLVCQ